MLAAIQKITRVALLKVEHVNPFISSTRDAFSSMLGVKVSRGAVALAASAVNQREIVGLIGISGRIKGVCLVAFPVETAVQVTNTWLCTDSTDIDDTVKDAVAELVNIIAGSAKAILSGDHQVPMKLSLPTIIHGEGFDVNFPSGTKWVEINFEGDLGAFCLRITIEETE